MLGIKVGAPDGALPDWIVGDALGSVLGTEEEASDGALLGRIVGEAL